MKIAILSRSPKAYSTRRIREAAQERGHTVQVLDTLRFAISVEEGDPDLYYKGKHLAHYDAVIPRIGTSITFFGCAVLRQFEQMGVFALNPSQAISVSRDKLRSAQIFSRHTIGLPASAFVREKTDVMLAIERLGGAPVIVKLLEGTQGVGVILAESDKIAEAIVQAMHSADLNVIIQKFVAESKGRDVRAFVVGDKVVGAMRRVAQGQEFRSNVHRGGTAQAITLDPEYERTAVQAAQIMGLRVAGVDMLESKRGPQVLEVNSSPGLEGIETATGINIADTIITQLEEQVLFPDIDLRQRLTLSKGYAVAEFPIGTDSEIAHRTLAETELRDREIVVLSINRNGVLIPSPRGAQELLPGDTLLCYGKLLALKALIPADRLKPPRKKKKADGTAAKSS